jgi:hypothetical protein
LYWGASLQIMAMGSVPVLVVTALAVVLFARYLKRRVVEIKPPQSIFSLGRPRRRWDTR